MKPAIIHLNPTVAMKPWPDFPESEISSGSRASNGHFWLNDKASGISVGLWESEANIGRWMKWPVHEFMVVVEGEVVMIEADREVVVGPGECFFIPKGRRCIWNQSGYFKKIMLMFDGPSNLAADSVQPITKIDPYVKLSPCVPPTAEFLLSPIHIQQVFAYFKDASGQFEVGVWETSACHGKVINSSCHELMHILEGAVTFTDDLGRSQDFKAGDTFFVPKGTPNSWMSEGLLRKIYCTIAPI